MKRFNTLIAVVFVVALANSAHAASYTIQNGLNSYSQQTNESMSINFGASGNTQWGQVFYGGQDQVEVISSTTAAEQRSNALVRFLGLDSIVGAGETVTSASLVLTSTYKHTGATPRDLVAFRSLIDWTDSTDGVNGSGGTYWTNYGSGGSASGYSGAEMGRIVNLAASDVGATISISLDAAAIQSWISNPASNFGLLLTMPHSSNGNFKTFEGSGQTNAPQLLIETTTATVPEPGSLAVLGLGGLLAMVRTRRTS